MNDPVSSSPLLPSEPSALMTAAPGLPNAAPVVVKTDLTGGDSADHAATARQEAFDAIYEWYKPDGTKYELKPWSIGREALWHRLCEADVPLPAVAVLQNLDAYAGHALKMLYLCSHEPRDWRHLRSDPLGFIEAIEEWGEANLPRSRVAEAVTLALRINNDAHLTSAVARPSDRKGPDLGN